MPPHNANALVLLLLLLSLRSSLLLLSLEHVLLHWGHLLFSHCSFIGSISLLLLS